MTTHTLKTLDVFFRRIVSGHKQFEVRKDDRPEGYKVGDILHLKEIDVNGDETGPYINVEVTFILSGGQYGVERGYVVMGVRNYE